MRLPHPRSLVEMSCPHQLRRTLWAMEEGAIGRFLSRLLVIGRLMDRARFLVLLADPGRGVEGAVEGC